MTTINNAIPQTKESQDQITPDMALQMLVDGNQRFVEGNTLNRDIPAHIETGKGGQWPYAAILGCIDSRVPIEAIFDQSIGDLFAARVAGNVVNGDLLGSLEYATKVAGSKLIMILGHTSCGAVKSACARVELGNITGLLANIIPAVETMEGKMDPDSDPNFANLVAEENVRLSIRNMFDQSEIIKDMADNGEIKVVGAIYDVMSGKVKLLD